MGAPQVAPTSMLEHGRRHKLRRKMTLKGIPAFHELQDIFANEQLAIQYLHAHGCLEIPDVCPQCGWNVEYRPNRNIRVKCGRRACVQNNGTFTQSIFDSTFFMGSRIKANVLLHFLYLLFVWGTSNKQVEAHFWWSSKTTVDWMRFVQQLMGEMVLDNIENYQVGGPGIEVQVDEAKLGKRKYNRGHRVEGVWVFGGVEKTEERKCFLIRVPNRSRETLFAAIRKFILPGSIIVSDCWRGYHGVDEIEGFFFEHETVKHSQNFVDPVTLACTNTIEGTWVGVKQLCPVRRRTVAGVQGCLLEFMWRRANAGRLWEAVLEALISVRYLKEEVNV